MDNMPQALRMLVEFECAEIYSAARARPEDNRSLGWLMEQVMGCHPEMAGISRPSTLRKVGRQWQVLIRGDIDPINARWLAAVRFARWWLPRYGAMHLIEEVEHRLAAAILAPRSVFDVTWSEPS